MDSEHLTAHIIRIPDSHPVDLAPVADALLLLHGNPELNAALSLAHNLNARRHARELHRQTVQSIAEYHRNQLSRFERELDNIADPTES